MDIKIKYNCRASGKHYILLEIELASKENTVRVINKTQSAMIDSVALFDFAQYPVTETPTSRQFVLMLPILSKTQNVTFLEFNKQGDIINEDTKSFNSEILKWSSRLNYKINKNVFQIREYDTSYSADVAHFADFKMTSTKKYRIMRFYIDLPAKYDGNITIKCFSKKYKLISDKAIFLDDSLASNKEGRGSKGRSLHVSMHLPDDENVYIFQAYNDGDPVLGFGLLEGQNLINAHAIGNNALVNQENNDTWNNIFKQKKATGVELERERITKFDNAVLFSIIVPVFNTNVKFFNEMVASVLDQTYSNLELILVNASPNNQKLTKQIEVVANRDKRIKVIDAPENLGISSNTNKGIEIATGDFICFLDHDDLIEPNSLYEYVNAINEDSNIDMLYSDEDNITKWGHYCTPKLKPPFAPDFLRSVNYICHFLCIRKSLLDEIGLLNPEFDGAQDYDLILRASEKTTNVCHISKVLYHWRMSAHSTASDINAKPYAKNAGIKALQAHLDRSGIAGIAYSADFPTTYKIKFQTEAPEPLISIIIPNKDAAEMLNNCIGSILERTTYQNYEIIIVENNSTEDETFINYKKLEEQDSRIKVVYYDGSFNFSKIVNFGVAHSSGEYALLLNNDTEVITGEWLTNMQGYCRRSNVGAVGAKLLYRDGLIQHAGVAVTSPLPAHINIFSPFDAYGYLFSVLLPQNYTAVTGACVMTKREVYDKVGGFSEEFVVAFNDVDFCLKVRELGLLVVFDANTLLYHDESVSRGYETQSPEKVIRFNRETALLKERWPSYFSEGDPFLNKHFTENGHFNTNFTI